jgi:hypothetical protein
VKRGGQSGFVARFRGRCTECEQVIEVGDLAGGNADRGYRHVTCPDAPDERPTQFQGTTLDEMGF